MNTLKQTIILLCTFTIISCSSINKNDANCGELAEFTVDKVFCQKHNIAETEFTVKYPSNLKTNPAIEGQQNNQYNYFFKRNENGIQTEAISLGYSTTMKNTPMKEQLSKEVLGQIQTMAEDVGFKFTDVYIGEEEFDGKKHLMFRAKGTIDNTDIELVGNYLILSLIVIPEVDNKNGVYMLMLANEESDIKTFKDFSSKGCISEVWNSLKFNY